MNTSLPKPFAAILVIAAALLSPSIAIADEYDTLREKLKDSVLGTSLYSTPISDPAFQARMETLDAKLSLDASTAPNTSGSGLWDLLNTSSGRTYLWPDLPFTGSLLTQGFDVYYSYYRLLQMATLYYSPGSSYYLKTALKTDIISALDWLYTNKYNASSTGNGNWYAYQIGAPRALTQIMALMKDDLTSTQFNNYLAALNKFLPTSDAQVAPNAPVITGSNLADQAINVVYIGIVAKSSTALADGADAITSLLAYTPPTADVGFGERDGFYFDGSFIQHFGLPYIGGYGAAYLDAMARVTYLLDGSTWEITDSNLPHLYQWVFDSIEPYLINGDFMDGVMGRITSFGPALGPKPNYLKLDSVNMMSALYYLSLAAPTTNATLGSSYPANPRLAIQRLLKQCLTADSTEQVLNYASYSIPVYLGLSAINDDSGITARGDLAGYWQFALQDRPVYWGPGFVFGVSMNSARIHNYESGNGNALRSWYTSDGMTYLYNSDVNTYHNFWQTINSYRLPGTTIDTQTRTAAINWINYRSSLAWVGGVEHNGLYGASGFDYKAPGDILSGPASGTTGNATLYGIIGTASNLVAKKSWFVFDDEVVALGAGITNTGQSGNGWDGAARRVETVYENRKLNDAGNNAFTVDGTAKSTTLGWSETISNPQWAHLQGSTSGDGGSIGYYFPTATTLSALRETRTGDYTQINQGYATAVRIPVIEDSYVQEGGSNHGTEAHLGIKNDITNYVREIYLKFDLTDYIHDLNVTFTSATVTLVPTYVGSTGNTITHTAEFVSNNSWTETGLLWSNKPSSSALSPAQQWNNPVLGTPITFNITGALQSALAGGSKIISLRVYASSAQDSNSYCAYGSRSNTAYANRPYLTLSGYKEPVTANYLTMTTSHGTNPTNATYAYVLLPGRSSTAVASYASAPDISILANTATVQAVAEKTLGMIQANFWTNATTAVSQNGQTVLTSDQKASVALEEGGGSLSVSVSDPTQAYTSSSPGQIDLEINRVATAATAVSSAITVTQLSPTIKLTVDVSDAYGTSFGATFTTPDQVIQASGDSYVDDGYPTTNYGTIAAMAVKDSTSGYNRISYVKFDVGSYQGPVHRAYITLHPVVYPGANTTCEAHVVTTSWNESTITWNNQPTIGSSLGTWVLPTSSSPPIEIDVTAEVLAAVTGANKTVSIAISAVTSHYYLSYGTRERTYAPDRPTLTIEQN